MNYDGWLKACPVDWTNSTTIMHIDDISIFDAWHSDFYWKCRMAHLNNMFPKESVCGRCNDWAGTPWNMGYEKVVQALAV
jgi:hypothetical protein